MRARLCLLTLLTIACAEGPASPTMPRAVAFDLQGAPTDPLAGPLDGRPAAATVLVFLSTHCPISDRYAPTLRALAGGWASAGVRMWLVYPDPDDDAAAIAAHQAAFALELPTLRDPGHVLVARAGVRVTPEAAVFGPGAPSPAYRGRIDDRVQGFGKIRPEAGAHELRDAVAAVVRGEPPRPAGGPAIGCYIADLQ